MSPEIVGLLNQLPLHTILMIGIIVLWRENRRLIEKLEGIVEKQEMQTDMLNSQNVEISQIKAQTRDIGGQ